MLSNSDQGTFCSCRVINSSRRGLPMSPEQEQNTTADECRLFHASAGPGLLCSALPLVVPGCHDLTARITSSNPRCCMTRPTWTEKRRRGSTDHQFWSGPDGLSRQSLAARLAAKLLTLRAPAAAAHLPNVSLLFSPVHGPILPWTRMLLAGTSDHFRWLVGPHHPVRSPERPHCVAAPVSLACSFA